MLLVSVNKVFKKMLYKIIPNLDKLIKLSDAIEKVSVTKDGSVYIEYKNHVIVKTNGGLLQYSDGIQIIKSNKFTHINPNNLSLNIDTPIDDYMLEKEKKLRQINNITK